VAGTSKIKSLGLTHRIEELISSGINTSAAISEALKKEGYNVSQPTVSRYLKETRDARKEETKDIVQEHVQKTIPTDLKALEDMEAKCLNWAEENPAAFTNRLADQHIDASLDSWIEKIYSAQTSDPDARRAIVKGIMSQCLSWIADDLSLQKSRIFAMRMATNIIDLKLRYSGILDGANEGGIYFVNPESGDRLVENKETGRLMVIKGGQE
jgi:predicted transcriptional regulator